MEFNLLTFLLSLLTGYGVYSLLVLLYNLKTLPRLESSDPVTYSDLNSKPLVSVLIPARDEEDVIASCLESMVNQDYQNLEILLLNDRSSDRTYEIAKEIEKKRSRFKVLDGTSLPEEWAGKCWAYEQLWQHSKGEIFVFVDADVQLEKSAVTKLVNELQQTDNGMIFLYLKYTTSTLGIRLLMPIIVYWSALSQLPVGLMQKLRFPKNFLLSGWCFALSRKTYERLGRHQKVKKSLIEDFALADYAVKRGYKVITYFTRTLGKVKTYDKLSEGVAAFNRNYFAMFGYNVPLTVLLLVSLSTHILIYPLILIEPLFLIPVFLILINKFFIASIRKEDYLVNMLLHPIQIALLIYVGSKSIYSHFTGNVIWKGRRYNNQ